MNADPHRTSTVRRRRLALAGAVLLAAGFFFTLEKRFEYCGLCGRVRKSLAWMPSKRRLLSTQYDSSLSKVMRDLIHEDRSDHQWTKWRETGSLPLCWVNSLWQRGGHGGMVPILSLGDLMSIVRTWDPKLAVAATRKYLDPDLSYADRQELGAALSRLPRFAAPHKHREAAPARAFLGLPPPNAIQIAANVSPEFTRRRGWSGLHWAAYWREPESALVMLAEGAPVDPRNNRQETPLHMAVWYGAHDVAGVLIAHGADLNATADWDTTPLHRAADIGVGRPELARMLLEAGADPNVRTSTGKTPLALALEDGHDEVAQILREHGGTE